MSNSAAIEIEAREAFDEAQYLAGVVKSFDDTTDPEWVEEIKADLRATKARLRTLTQSVIAARREEKAAATAALVTDARRANVAARRAERNANR